MLSDSFNRFKKDYLHRALQYLVIMIITWIIVTLVIRYSNVHQVIWHLIDKTSPKGGNESFLGLYGHNLSSGLGIIIVGLIPIPLYYLWITYNAITIGALLGLSPNPFAMFLAGVLPHGIFEISSQLFAAAISATLVHYVYQRLRHRTEEKFSNTMKNIAIDTILYVAIPLFFAALIETYITPLILQSVLG